MNTLSLPSREQLKQLMSSKSYEELYDISYVHPQDYASLAVESARHEVRGRSLDIPELDILASAAEEQRRQEQAHLPWPLRIFAFFFTTIGFGIPMILARRHFVTRSAECKAREWKQWSLLGLGFYVSMAGLWYLLATTRSCAAINGIF
jgi:hypothetical protein